jgi:hypothetical protein
MAELWAGFDTVAERDAEPRMKLRYVLTVSMGALFAPPILAQNPPDARARVAMTAGLATVPDGISGDSCTPRGGIGVELGATYLSASRSWFVMGGSARVVRQLSGGDCVEILRAVDTSYAESLHRDPVVATAARIGLETPSGYPLVRATANAGVVWGSPLFPALGFSVATGTRGRSVRLVVEFERWWTRVRGREITQAFPDGPEVRDVVGYPHASSFRIGAEVPLGRAR